MDVEGKRRRLDSEAAWAKRVGRGSSSTGGRGSDETDRQKARRQRSWLVRYVYYEEASYVRSRGLCIYG